MCVCVCWACFKLSYIIINDLLPLYVYPLEHLLSFSDSLSAEVGRLNSKVDSLESRWVDKWVGG